MFLSDPSTWMIWIIKLALVGAQLLGDTGYKAGLGTVGEITMAQELRSNWFDKC